MTTQDTEFASVFEFGEGRVIIGFGVTPADGKPCVTFDMDGKVHEMDKGVKPYEREMTSDAILLTFTDAVAIRRIGCMLLNFAYDVEAEALASKGD